MTTNTRTIATARLTETEQQMLTYAQMLGLTPGERREFLYYLDVADMPQTPQARVTAVVERILGGRLDAGRSDWDREARAGWQHTADRWNPETLDFNDSEPDRTGSQP